MRNGPYIYTRNDFEELRRAVLWQKIERELIMDRRE